MTLISSKKLTLNWPALKWVGIISLFLLSCDPPKEIGAELFSVEVGLNYTDTVTVNSSTVLIDSVYTGANNSFLLGSYFHPALGYVTSDVYTQIANADSLKSKENSIADSLKMYLVYTNFQGDLAQQQSLKIYRLKDSLSRSTNYFTNSAVSYFPEVLTTHNFFPKPIFAKSINGDSVKYDTLKFHLGLTLAKELMSKYANKSISGGGSSFRDFFKGFYIQTAETKKAALLNFSPAYSKMTLHWHNPKDTVKYYLNYYFSLSNTYTQEFNARFNQIKSKKVGVLTGLVKSGDKISSLKANNTSYVQSGTGIVTKIELPYLTKLKGNNNIAVNKAELVFHGSDNLDLGQTIGQLSLVESDGSSRPVRNTYGIKYYIAEGGSGVQTANYNSSSNTYSFNVTTIMQALLSGSKANLGFLLTPAISADASGNAKISSESARFIPLNALKAKLKIYYSYIAKAK